MFSRFPALTQFKGGGPRQRKIADSGLWEGPYGQTIEMPKGKVVNGASTPWWLWWLFPPFADQYESSAVLHDIVYGTGKENGMTRWDADGLFRSAMASQGVPLWKRWLMWAAVRLFGAGHFVDTS